MIQSYAAGFEFVRRVDGIVSTFALILGPEYDPVIKNASAALPAGQRLVILGFKMPEKWPMWRIMFFVTLTRPFGVTLDLGQRQLWESAEPYLRVVDFKRYTSAQFLSPSDKPVDGQRAHLMHPRLMVA